MREMRPEPHPQQGRCHDAHYGGTEMPQILCPDVHGPHAVPVAHKTAATAVGPSPGLMTLPASGARLGGVRLVHQHGLHPQPRPLVRDHLAEPAKRPPVELLVGFCAVLDAGTNIADVANHDGLHASLVERGDKVLRLLVENVLNLPVQFPDRAPLGPDEFLAPLAAPLGLADIGVEASNGLGPVAGLAADEPSAVERGLFPVVHGRGAEFTLVHRCHAVPQGGARRNADVGGPQFVAARFLPADFDLPGQVERPGDDQRFIPLAVGEDELALLQADTRRFPGDFEEPLAPPGVLGLLAPFLFAGIGALDAGVEVPHHRVRGVGVEVRGDADTLHAVLREEDGLAPVLPGARLAEDAPVGDDRAGVQLPRRPRQMVEQGRGGEVEFPHDVEAQFSSPSRFSPASRRARARWRAA